jgi:chemotaxis protein MotB
VAQFDSSSRLGRSQGAIIFWGLISLFFAVGACFYYGRNAENERNANKLRDQVLALQDQCEALTAEKDKLQTSNSDAEKQLKTREDLVQEKETKLAEEETKLEAQGAPPLSPNPKSDAQTAVIKKFTDTVHKLTKGDDTEVASRGGRPLLRLPSSAFFGPDDAILKPDGKVMLNQLADALDGQLTSFELRVETFTDQAEIDNGPDAPAKPPAAGAKPATPPAKPKYNTPWELTAARAAVISRFLRDQTKLPFQNVVVIARADSDPVPPPGKDAHVHNRRVEFSIAPLPDVYHAPEPDKPDSSDKTKTDKTDKSPKTPPNPLEPPPEPPAAKKDKTN